MSPHKENGDPCQPNVIKGDGPLEGVLIPGPALRVVLVPVDAGAVVETSVVKHRGRADLVVWRANYWKIIW